MLFEHTMLTKLRIDYFKAFRPNSFCLFDRSKLKILSRQKCKKDLRWVVEGKWGEGGRGGETNASSSSTPAPRKTSLDHSRKEVRVLEQVLLIG